MAAPAQSNIELLISGNRWKEASRAIFIEAKTTDKFEWSIPAGQAKAGFLDDALETIGSLHPNMQPGALLTLVTDVPTIPPKKTAELLQRALNVTRKMSGKNSNYLKSGELTKVALFYSGRGAESDARTIFEEALRAAESATTEEGSGGYRQVTEAMVQARLGKQEWMVLLVANHLQREEQEAKSKQGWIPLFFAKRIQRERTTVNSAFAYLDLAKVSVQINKNNLAIQLIELGISAAKNITQGSKEKSALEALAIVAIDAGYTKKLPEAPAEVQAILEARSGNPQKAIDIASGLQQNLYVDHGQYVRGRVFDDAVKRNDLKTALYLAEHSSRPNSWTQADSWRQIAELQAKRKARMDAANSYAMAVQANSKSGERYFENIRLMVAIGTSMRQNGFELESRKATLDALTMIDTIHPRRVDDHIRGFTRVAASLWGLGLQSEAKQQILRAYRSTREYSDNHTTRKAELLSEIGQVTTTFMLNSSPQRE